jgi:hypothetical protein
VSFLDGLGVTEIFEEAVDKRASRSRYTIVFGNYPIPFHIEVTFPHFVGLGA